MSGVVSFKLVLLGMYWKLTYRRVFCWEVEVGFHHPFLSDPALRCALSRTSSTTFARVPSEVRCPPIQFDTAAFLTQTVRRDDETTVKLEIW